MFDGCTYCMTVGEGNDLDIVRELVFICVDSQGQQWRAEVISVICYLHTCWLTEYLTCRCANRDKDHYLSTYLFRELLL